MAGDRTGTAARTPARDAERREGGTALPEPKADEPRSTDDPQPAADKQIHIWVREQVSPAEGAAALRLADAAAAADGVAPLSEEARLHLHYGGDPGAMTIFLRRGGAGTPPPAAGTPPAAAGTVAEGGPAEPDASPPLVGLAYLSRPDETGERGGELVVHPAQRGQGLGLLLARTVLAQARGQAVSLWAHGDLPAAAALAAAAGFARVRGLWQMRRPLDEPIDEPLLPPGVALRAFEPGRDEDAWLRLNATAFATHPEQGRWTLADLERREREPWFDPAGFFLAERDGQLAGFHWTKIHESTGRLIGEVYVVAAHPGMRGSGLGRALTLAGLRYLRGRGASEVLLYVDESNTPAVRLYESLGFGRARIDVMYRHEPTGS